MPAFDLATIGAGLPFAAAVPRLSAALAEGAVVVQAPPGTGKTTLAPPVVANEVSGRVIVTQPRRVAVRAAARRLAQLSGTTLGDTVGYSVRGESRTGAGTLVEFVTPGLLVRRLLADPELTGVAAVVLDEVHERSLDSDLLVGMLTDVRELRDDLVLVAMSATLDASTFAALLGGGEAAPLVDCPAALHSLDVAWVPAATPRTDARGVTRAFLDHVATTTADAVNASQADVDALVFLPGVREVSHVAGRLRETLKDIDVLELHGRIDPREQDRITAGRTPGEARRVVVSTALAESSLTVPGVRLVIDAGLSREPRRDVARAMAGLVTVACSRASAEQRAGRAARLGPGRVVRCYDERTFARMAEHVTPEITTADLTSTALTLAAWGTPGGVGLALPTPPPPAAIRDATAALTTLGAFADGHLTALGRILADMPVDPPLARALLDASGAVGARRSAEVIAALADDVRASNGDLTSAIRALSGPTRARWAKEVARLERLAGRVHDLPQPPPDDITVPPELVDGFVVALAFPTRVARRVSGEIYLLAGGTRAALAPNSPLRHHDWLAIADVTRTEGRVAQGTGAVVRLTAPLSRDLAERAARHLLVDEVRATWDDGRVTGRRVQALGAIEFSATPTKPTPQAAHRAVAAALEARGLGLLTWSDAATAFRNRLAFIHHHLGEPWPSVDDASLLERLDEWFGPELDRLARGARVSQIDLIEPLRRLLPWPEATRFDELAPERLRVPSGSHVRVTYPPHDDAGAAPVIAVKLQECFGMSETPRLADGRAPVLFHLLSPAGRPLAITDDLASFWAGAYAGVRADMRGRYPKHPWPEEPSTHIATAKTKNRL